MATRTVTVGGGNYNSIATWMEGAVPTTADAIVFSANSGNLTINVSSSASTVNFTNYTGTVTVNATWFVFGDINFGTGGYNYAGSNSLAPSATSTITSNGTAWKGNIQLLGTNKTYTLADDMTLNGTLTMQNTTTAAINGNRLFCKGNLTVVSGKYSGTTEVVMYGTGTISGGNSAAYLMNDLTIAPTGTTTFGSSFVYNTGTLTYVSGTVITTGSTLTIAASTTLNTNGITWNNINFTANSTIALLSDLVSIGTVSHYIGGTITFNNFNFYIGGNISLSNGRVFNGTTKIIFNTSTSQNIYVDGAYLGGIRNDLDINATGTVDINWLSYGGGTLTYIAGNVIFSGSKNLAINASCTLDVSGINWSNIGTGYSATITLASDLTCENTFNIALGSLIVNGSTLYCKGSLIFSSGGGNSVRGTTNIEFTGSASGTWMSNTTNNAWRNNVTINKSGGTLTIGTLLAYNTGTLTYLSGNVITTGSTLNMVLVDNNTILDTSGMIWNNITVTEAASRILNLASDLNYSGTGKFGSSSQLLTLSGANINVLGSGIFTANDGHGSPVSGVTTQVNLLGDNVSFNDCAWSGGNFSAQWALPININTNGTCTITGRLTPTNNFILNYSAGTVLFADGFNPKSLQPLAGSNTQYNLSGMTWDSPITGASGTLTFNTPFLSNSSLVFGTSGNLILDGNAGATFASLTGVTAGRFMTLKNGNIYNITNNLTISGTSISKITLQSSASSSAFFNLQYGATQNVKNTNATWINSIGGQTIYVNAGSTLSNTVNWNVGTYYEPSNFLMMF